MNAGELADSLEYWREKIVESQSINEDKLSTSAFASAAFNHAEVILKSLRFSACIERLMSDPMFMLKTSVAYGQVDILTSVAWVHAKDIYTAARNAVEKLEGK